MTITELRRLKAQGEVGIAARVRDEYDSRGFDAELTDAEQGAVDYWAARNARTGDSE